LRNVSIEGHSYHSNAQGFEKVSPGHEVFDKLFAVFLVEDVEVGKSFRLELLCLESFLVAFPVLVNLFSLGFVRLNGIIIGQILP
jgi:hypothetical protein